MVLNKEKVVLALDTILTTDIDDELGLMDIEKGYYYTLDCIGKSVWALLDTKRTIEEIVRSLMKDYDVSYETCEKDVVELLEALVTNGLVKIVN